MIKKVMEFFTKMIALTGKVATLEVKIDSGFQRLDQRIDAVEKRIDDAVKRLDQRLDDQDSNMDLLHQDLKGDLASIQKAMDKGFADAAQHSTLIDRMANMQLDIERLKAAARS